MLKLGPPDRRKGAQKGERKGIEIKKNFVKLFWYEMSFYRPMFQLLLSTVYQTCILIDWLIERKGKREKRVEKRKEKKGKEREKKRKIQESGEGNGK